MTGRKLRAVIPPFVVECDATDWADQYGLSPEEAESHFRAMMSRNIGDGSEFAGLIGQRMIRPVNLRSPANPI